MSDIIVHFLFDFIGGGLGGWLAYSILEWRRQRLIYRRVMADLDAAEERAEKRMQEMREAHEKMLARQTDGHIT